MALMQTPPQFVPLSETWSDYDGDEIYGDYTITPGTPPTITNQRSFVLGVGLVDPWATTGGANTQYYHADLIGTLRSKSDSTGAATDRPVYTAFGELVTGPTNRFGYAGAWGYQFHDEFPFLHVGHRYYDPASGRFLQRDPIGIIGSVNVYAYIDGEPTVTIDPDGLKKTSICLPPFSVMY